MKSRPRLVCLLGFAAACGSSSSTNVDSAAPAGAPDAGAAGLDGWMADVAMAVDAPVEIDGDNACPVAPATQPAGTPVWDTLAGLKSAQTFYASPAGIYVAENLLYYQNDDGGWPKNIDMSTRATARDAESMIDNSATTTQIRYMAFMIKSWPQCQRYKDSFNRGMGWIWNAQYKTNGGWPQSWPKPHIAYAKHITYNDNAMTHVLQLLRDIVYGNTLFAFVDDANRAQAAVAMNKGIDCVLKTQIVSAGKKTGWCAQHDEETLLPANARAYELASESGNEGAQILAFLMSLDLSRADMPKQDLIDAVEAATQFYDSVKIVGYRWVETATDAGPADYLLVADPSAAPLWARFYELDTLSPFFCDRDGVKKYDVAEIGYERRSGYSWYGTWPSAVLKTTYPTWAAKWTPGRNVLSVDAGS